MRAEPVSFNGLFRVGLVCAATFLLASSPARAQTTLVGRFDFEDPFNSATDSSGNGNDPNSGSSWGSPTDTSDTNAAVGSYSERFFGNSSLSWVPGATSFTNIWNTLAGTFSVSAWVKTTVTVANDSDDAASGAVIVWAYNDHNGTNDVIPLSITGSKVAFSTRDHSGTGSTLHSTTSVTDGKYHLIAVTRNQGTGEKKVYVDGVLEATETGTTELLNGNDYYLDIGGVACCAAFSGLLDDVRIYSGVLSDSDIAALAAEGYPEAHHIAVAHYAFDDSGNLGRDTSGNGNDLDFDGSPYGGSVNFTSDAESGGGAADFDGGSFLSYSATPPSLLDALAGSFSISVWVKTDDSVGNQGDYAFNGAGIVTADVGGLANDSVPLALTGGEAAFNTGDVDLGDDTLNSSATVNDNTYHHIVVTRDRTTGEKRIYIDGNLDSTSSGTQRALTDPRLVGIGAQIDASQSDPNSANPGNFFYGQMDDLQIYPWAISSDDVAYLHNNPGSILGSDFNQALDTSGLDWTTSGDSNWSVESDNTFDGVSAASSGSVTGNQSSTLSVTVTGPGKLMFYWSCIANDPNFSFDYEFDIDGQYQNDIYGDTDWYQDGPYDIGPGTHTLSWTTYANGDTDPTQAGFLDQVSFATGQAPVITQNPFDQTNFPGYPVWLSAAANSNPTATWQWYKVGFGMIAGATNSYYSPTNAGTAGVAGNYYAVASNIVSSANTITAAVMFVSAPLPPDWSIALKSPFAALNSSNVTKDFYTGCAVDAAGDVYAAAQYIGDMNVLTNGNVQATFTAVGADGGAALVKHASNGDALWAVGLTNADPSSSSYGFAVAAAPGNGAYLAATLNGINWLGTNRFESTNGSSILLARFDADGSNLWSRLIHGTNGVFNLNDSLVSDPSGNVTLSGLMSGTVNFVGTNLSVSGQGGFVAQYDANGTVRWAETTPNLPFGLGSGGGPIYLALLSTTSGGTTNVGVGGMSILTDRAYGVAAINANNGQAIWVKGVAGQYGSNPRGLSDDVPRISVAGTNVFLTGTAYGSQALFGNLSVSIAGRGQYLARYDSSGNPQLATGFGSPTTTIWASVADAAGDVYISGDFDDYSYFGDKLVAAPVYAQNDLGPNYFTQAFLAKLDRNGDGIWAREAISSDEVNLRGIALTTDGVWTSGFLKETNSIPVQFGAYRVDSDLQIIVNGVIGILVWHQGGVLAKVTESVALPPSPVTLIDTHLAGGRLLFSFESSFGRTNSVESSSNLTSGIWTPVTNILGDGTVWQFSFPITNPPMKFFRVETK